MYESTIVHRKHEKNLFSINSKICGIVLVVSLGWAATCVDSISKSAKSHTECLSTKQVLSTDLQDPPPTPYSGVAYLWER
jgi:hypothetical protein